MKLRKFLCALILALFSLQTLNFTALADEGMWPFNNVPRAEIKKKYGFDVTDEWLRKVQLASVRFNSGGSGSFVSPNGLVLTNYHIVEDIVNDVSTPQKDLAKEGFVARTPAEEIKAPSLELNVLMSIEDVTARVNGAVKTGTSDAQAFAARRAEIAAIEAESTKATGLRSDVIALYQGAQYNLYRYKKYTDVRLVFVPEFQAAFFGGDPDNFNFPRFNIDMALVRVYENDQPVHPPSYFKWSPTGAKEDEVVCVTGNPGSTARWDAIAKAHQSLPSYIRERRIFDQAAGFNTTTFGFARTLVRLADESQKPNAERLPEFTDARRASLELALYSPAPIYDDFEKLKLADSLGYMVELLGAGPPLVKQIMNGKTPEARANELVEGTKLKEVAFRKELAAGGQQAIESSTDPMIVLARLIDPKARELRRRYENEVTGVERTNYAKIARARFANEGTSIYPDATFTLRLSYGAVKGYLENGKRVAPFTTLGGLYDRAANFKYQFPYNLPPRWMEKKPAIKMSTPFNFVSTDDIIGGNSGSPTINKNAELVGLIFDGNIQSLVGDFIYDESVNRAISVDVRAMREVLRKVFGANEIADEVTK